MSSGLFHSPNHEELAWFLSATPADSTPSTVEDHISSLIPTSGIGPDGQGAIVVRSGALGACVGTRRSQDETTLHWVPAYWTAEEKDEVRDVTGGKLVGSSITPYDALSWDNLVTSTFSFKLAILSSEAWWQDSISQMTTCAKVSSQRHCFCKLKAHCMIPATLYASVSASYVVQQFGLPVLTRSITPESEEATSRGRERPEELWNGESSWSRLEKLKMRMTP